MLYVGLNDGDFVRNGPNSGFDINDAKTIKSYLKSFEIVRELLPIYRFIQQSSVHASGAASGHAPNQYIQEDYTVADIHEETEKLAKENAAAFKFRMVTLLDEIQSMGATPICVTQPHRYVISKNNQLYGIPKIMGDEFSGIDYDYSIKQINNVIFELCGENAFDLYGMDFSKPIFMMFVTPQPQAPN